MANLLLMVAWLLIGMSWGIILQNYSPVLYHHNYFAYISLIFSGGAILLSYLKGKKLDREIERVMAKHLKQEKQNDWSN